MPAGLDPEAVARRIVEAIEADERDVPGFGLLVTRGVEAPRGHSHQETKES